jgi:hypothetical protein
VGFLEKQEGLNRRTEAKQRKTDGENDIQYFFGHHGVT